MNTSFKCPICQKPMVWDIENKFRPFCSERCKLVDLGAWADGSYSIPTTSTPFDAEEQADQEVEPSDDPEM